MGFQHAKEKSIKQNEETKGEGECWISLINVKSSWWAKQGEVEQTLSFIPAKRHNK